MTLIFDIATRKLGRQISHDEPPRMRGLHSKQFSFLLFLALRRSDDSDGWVVLDEVVSRVGPWQGQDEKSAGKTIWRYFDAAWFEKLVDHQGTTTGPYRLRPDVRFVPDRDAALTYITTTPASSRSGRKPSQRTPDRLELQAYDLIAQYGFYPTPVVDLIYQRIGQPERLRDAPSRLTALRILVTLDKVRGKPDRALERARNALKLARRLNRRDDVCYLLDQVAGAHHILGNSKDGERVFREEIDYVGAWGTSGARRHLIHAYRGLAATLRVQGRRDEALAALRTSADIAHELGNEEAQRLADLEERRILGTLSAADLSRMQVMPSHHPIAQVMSLNVQAEQLLAAGERQAASEMAKRARSDAERLNLTNEMMKSNALLAQIGLQKLFAPTPDGDE